MQLNRHFILSITLFLTLILILPVGICLANENKTPPLKKFVISHVAHPKIDSLNILLADVYQQLGFKVEFIPVPSRRGLSLVNDGIVDGDSIRVQNNIKNYKNILIVKPSLLHIYIVLVCQKGIPCAENVLKDNKSQVMLGRGAREIINEKGYSATFVLNEKQDIILELLRANRFHYALYNVNASYQKELQQEFNLVVIASPKYFHVINKKHLKMLPAIEKKLKEVLLTSEFN